MERLRRQRLKYFWALQLFGNSWGGGLQLSRHILFQIKGYSCYYQLLLLLLTRATIATHKGYSYILQELLLLMPTAILATHKCYFCYSQELLLLPPSSTSSTNCYSCYCQGCYSCYSHRLLLLLLIHCTMPLLYICTMHWTVMSWISRATLCSQVPQMTTTSGLENQTRATPATPNCYFCYSRHLCIISEKQWSWCMWSTALRRLYYIALHCMDYIAVQCSVIQCNAV